MMQALKGILKVLLKYLSFAFYYSENFQHSVWKSQKMSHFLIWYFSI